MSITIQVDNTANTPAANPPGYNFWIGQLTLKSEEPEGGGGLAKKEIAGPQPIENINPELPLKAWYYDYGWYTVALAPGSYTLPLDPGAPPIVLPAVRGHTDEFWMNRDRQTTDTPF